jgi:hypothetical protein
MASVFFEYSVYLIVARGTFEKNINNDKRKRVGGTRLPSIANQRHDPSQDGQLQVRTPPATAVEVWRGRILDNQAPC